jgi:GNAT superfamily N-acetyltransferase
MQMEIVVHPLSPDRWNDLEEVFGAKGCSTARGCWCMYYRESGAIRVPAGEKPSECRKRKLKDLAGSGSAPGLIGYLEGRPVGWVSLGPRSEYPRLRRSPVMKPVDDMPVWSIVCFVVAGPFRHQGVATGLLRGAIEYAREMGATMLEAYPVDRPEPGRDEWLWFGAKTMFDRAGFIEVARRRPGRPVVRLDLTQLQE